VDRPRDPPSTLIARIVIVGSALTLAGAAADAGGVNALSHASLRVPGESTGVHAVAFVMFGVAVAVLAAAALLLVRRPRRGSGERRVVSLPAGTRWDRAVAAAIALVVIAAPIVLLLLALHTRSGHTPQTATPRPASVTPGPARPSPPRPAAQPHQSGRTGVDTTTVAILVSAAVAASAAVLLRRRGTGRAERGGDTGDVGPDDGSEVRLTEASVDAARQALAEPGSPRQVVIAAYVAMTKTLTAADPAAATTPTPRRVLARAADAGVVDVSAANTVVELFEKARFSRHPVTIADRDAAETALDVVRAQLSFAAGSRS
jgi:hypothetical protein